MRQRLMVEYMMKNRKGLTRTHGFFIIMGGFHKFSRARISKPAVPDPTNSISAAESGEEKAHKNKRDEEPYGTPSHPLDRFDVCWLLDEGKLELPPEVEFEDKSKSNWIAKSIVLLQTLWFVIQCIARKLDGLPLTELEVVTLGYALLNFVIYVIWWNKPQNVTRPIRVFCGQLPDRTKEQWELTHTIGEWNDKLFDAVLGRQDRNVDLRRVKQTPTLYSGNPPKNWPLKAFPIEYFAIMMAAVVGGMFGGIHFIAWSAQFPTYNMLLLWRCGSILMTIASFPPLFTLLFGPVLRNEADNETLPVSILRCTLLLPVIIFGALSLFFVPLAYITGRVITLMIAFKTLSTLPPEAFRTVQWTNLLPHI
ncbi:hypothetical protein FRB91_002731 [Serendipita sp. 411]|nr:hypothetical protein FRB91_002731 [Serendipita sp. 411]